MRLIKSSDNNCPSCEEIMIAEYEFKRGITRLQVDCWEGKDKLRENAKQVIEVCHSCGWSQKMK